MEHVNRAHSYATLGKKDMYRLLRWGPWQRQTWLQNILKPNCCARRLRPAESLVLSWARGRPEAVLCSCCAPQPIHIPPALRGLVTGGMGAVTQAMAVAAKKAGAEIRTGVEVIEVRVKDGAATSVVLSTGEEISATAIVSNADPKRTLLKLVDSTHLSPDFVMKLQHYRMPGTVAKVNLALSGLPKFNTLDGNTAASEQPH